LTHSFQGIEYPWEGGPVNSPAVAGASLIGTRFIPKPSRETRRTRTPNNPCRYVTYFDFIFHLRSHRPAAHRPQLQANPRNAKHQVLKNTSRNLSRASGSSGPRRLGDGSMGKQHAPPEWHEKTRAAEAARSATAHAMLTQASRETVPRVGAKRTPSRRTQTLPVEPTVRRPCVPTRQERACLGSPPPPAPTATQK
jgi:hypothetical protein